MNEPMDATDAAIWLYDNADQPFDMVLNELMTPFSERWDGDEDGYTIAQSISEHYGPLDRALYALDYEGEIDDIVTITYNRKTGAWAIAGVGPEPHDSGLEPRD